jgi:hypothetical protein
MPVDPQAQQSINEQNVYIRDTLMSIAAKYAETLKDAVQEAFDDVDATVLENVGKDLTRSFTKLAKMSDEFANNQSRIRKGLLSQKDVEKQINSIQEKREALERKIEHAKRLGLKVSEEDYASSLESLKVQEEQLKKDKELAKSVSGRIGLQKGLNSLQEKYLAGFKEFFTIAGLMKILIDSGFRFSKISTDIGKNLGYGADRANDLTNSLVTFARSTSNANITLQNAADAMNELSSATGYVAEYSTDALETQIMLTKQFQLTADEAAGVYKFSVLTGKASSDINKQMVGAFAATRNNLRAGVPFKAAMAEAAKVSGILASNLQNNPKRIVEAVVQAKALGTSLEQTAKQGEALLNFESSIESELKAELITGKQINLEKARAAALVGDQVTLTEELVNQVGSIEEFDRMNVIQKKALAESVGLTADELARQLQNQKIALETGKSLAQVTEEELTKAQQRQDAQTKFNNAVAKLQDLIGNVVAGPLGQLLEILGDVLNVVSSITKGIQEAFGSTAAKTFLGALAGFAAGGVPGLLIGAGIGAASGIFGDDVMGYGARTLITPQGAIALNNNDTVVAGTNLFKGDDVMSFPKGALSMGGADFTPMINAINEVRTAVKELTNRPVNINIDGKQVGTSLVQGTYRLA